MFKDGVSEEINKRQVNAEVENYKNYLKKNRVQHKIVEEAVQNDGSVIIKIIKQYNTSPVGDYLN